MFVTICLVTKEEGGVAMKKVSDGDLLGGKHSQNFAFFGGVIFKFALNLSVDLV